MHGRALDKRRRIGAPHVYRDPQVSDLLDALDTLNAIDAADPAHAGSRRPIRRMLLTETTKAMESRGRVEYRAVA